MIFFYFLFFIYLYICLSVIVIVIIIISFYLFIYLFSIFVSKKNHFSASAISRSSHREVFLGKGVLRVCSKFTGEHPCRSAISIKFQSNFIEIALRLGCSPENLLHIFRTPFPKNTSGRPLLPSPTKIWLQSVNWLQSLTGPFTGLSIRLKEFCYQVNYFSVWLFII